MVINNYLLPIHAQKMVSAFIPYSVPNSISFCVPRFTRYQVFRVLLINAHLV